MRSFIRNNFPEFGLAVGAVISILVTVIVCVLEWVENPGGIFRGDEGTRWQFVFETAWSWLIPTFVHAVVAVSLMHLFWTVTIWVIKKVSNSRRIH